MLIEFSIENFRSIKDKVTLSLEATADRSLDNNIIAIDEPKKTRLLRSAVVYGANASGKSNLLLALRTLQEMVKNSHKNQRGDKLDYSPFKFDKKTTSSPTKFEITFIQNGVKYIYKISYNQDRVVDESLYYYPRGRKAQIFERKNTKDYKFNVDKKDQEFISGKTLENTLYLSSATQLNYKKTSIAYDWFAHTLESIRPVDYDMIRDRTIKMLDIDKTFKEKLLKALKIADIGILDIQGKVEKIPSSRLEELPDAIKEFIGALKKIKGAELGVEMFEVKTIHGIINKDGLMEKYDLAFLEESDGTKRLFALLGLCINALEKGLVLVIDEMDIRLHNLLSFFIVKLFHDPEQNKNNAQLIFATHNTDLLDQDLFRRDQIWFTERDPKIGSTKLSSLVDFRVRKDKDIKKGYLAGRYGGLPFIVDEKIFE